MAERKAIRKLWRGTVGHYRAGTLDELIAILNSGQQVWKADPPPSKVES